MSIYKHNFIHYFEGLFCWVFLELVLAYVYMVVSVNNPNLNLSHAQAFAVLLLLILFIIWVWIVKKFDYILIEDGYIEAKCFNFGNFQVESLSTAKSKIRACEYSRFLCWNKITIKGPLGVTLTMHNIRNIKELVFTIRGNW